MRRADLVLLAGARTPIRFEHTAPPVLPDGVPVVQLAEETHTMQDLTAALDGPAPEAVAFRDDAIAAHRTRTAQLRRDADDRGRRRADQGPRADAPAVRRAARPGPGWSTTA